MVTRTGHIGIHKGADGRTDVRTLYVRTDDHDVMAIKPNFLTSMGYHIFLTMVLLSVKSCGRPCRPFHINVIMCSRYKFVHFCISL